MRNGGWELILTTIERQWIHDVSASSPIQPTVNLGTGFMYVPYVFETRVTDGV